MILSKIKCDDCKQVVRLIYRDKIVSKYLCDKCKKEITVINVVQDKSICKVERFDLNTH